MEQNFPIVTKKVWNMMKLAFFMLRKGICKKKILLDLSLLLKRGKLAGKTLTNLMFHHHASTWRAAGVGGTSHLQHSFTGGPQEFEFSCSNTPLYGHYITNNKKKNHENYYSCSSSPLVDINSIEDVNMFEMTMMPGNDGGVAASPAFPGFGLRRSPMVRQLRITDSPYPLQNDHALDDKRVDEAAEAFIKRFYSQLKQQAY